MPTLRQLIQARVKTQVTDFKEVAGAANLRAVLEGRVSPPGCYVYPLRNRPGRNALTTGVAQQVIEAYGLVVVNRNVADARHGDSADENEALRIQLSDALLAWQPDASSTQLEYGGGQLVSMADGLFYWQEIYNTTRQRRAV